MKTLEEQIHDYTGFVADETHTYEVHAHELRSVGEQTTGRRGVSIPPSAQSTGVGQPAGKKRKLTLALVAQSQDSAWQGKWPPARSPNRCVLYR
jgi:hypothetical protein